VIRRYGAAFLAGPGARLTPSQRKVLAALAACRTHEMGSHDYVCEHCGQAVSLYNSCNDRHCPQCQAGRRAAWLEKRRQELLPVEYFHVVFTVPEELTVLAAAHPRAFYTLLFRAVKDTLLEMAADPQHLGVQLGGLMVLHTWGQTLVLHPHVHVLVPGGGLSPDGRQWRACPRGFFLRVEVLSAVFRGKLLEYLKQEQQAGGLPLTGGLAHRDQPARFAQWLSPLYDIDWVVYVEPPEDREPEQVLKYLARYTYRVAISNDRLVSLDDGQVTFRYKDYARGKQWRQMRLPADEFLRRFCQHILPPHFMRVRAFGWMANCHRAEKLALIRRLLAVPTPVAESPPEAGWQGRACCPCCGQESLRLIGRRPRPCLRDLVARTDLRPAPDSS
jgi:hypothetical protein